MSYGWGLDPGVSRYNASYAGGFRWIMPRRLAPWVQLHMGYMNERVRSGYGTDDYNGWMAVPGIGTDFSIRDYFRLRWRALELPIRKNDNYIRSGVAIVLAQSLERFAQPWYCWLPRGATHLRTIPSTIWNSYPEIGITTSAS